MSAPYSITNSILQNIIDTIAGIDGLPTYTNTIAATQVSDSDIELDKHITDMTVFPYFAVVNGQESRIYEPSFNRVEVVFDILCTFKDLGELAINSYIDDIERALAVDVTRGTTECWESKILNVSRDSYRLAESFRRSVISVQCIYGYRFGQPGTAGSL